MVKPFPGNFARLDGLEHGIVRSREISGNQQKIIARLKCLNRGTADVVGEKMCEAGHVERVGDDDALESELLLEQVGNNRRGDRGHMIGVGIERGHRDVCDHHGIDAGRDRSLEGW